MGKEHVLNFFNPVFWGVKDPEIFTELMRVVANQTNGYHFADNMFVFQRNNSMFHDKPFMDSWESNAISNADKGIVWRRYIKAIAGYHCSHLEGDFVECGAYQGVGAKTVIDYLGGPAFPKTFWLYDMFEHNAEMVNHSMPAHGEGLYEQVCGRFEGYPNVRIFKGFLPDVLAQGSPEKIAYLHIDLNQAPAEIATLDALFDRVVPGGMIILDDYEMLFYREQKFAEDDWFGQRGYKVFPLPTCQGFVIKTLEECRCEPA
ncbi:MAG: TylF/MycF/NovP-related O-methyltransferase [Burkholderiaceae bacterium]